jgi:serine/threonine protein kinase
VFAHFCRLIYKLILIVSIGKQTIVMIKKMPFIWDAYHINRFRALIEAWKRQLILAHRICLLQDGKILNITTVEYGYVNYQKSGLRSLKDFLCSDEEITKDYELRNEIYYNLLNMVNQLHEMGVPHLSINPEKIWLKNNTRVYLLPYDVHYEENNDKYAIWYTAPEYLFNSPEFYFNYEWDVWSLGCIFYDLFVGTPPLFASIDPHSKLIKLFELLGFPQLEYVPYINEDAYENLHENVFQKEWKIGHMPHIYTMLEDVDPQIANTLLNMLHYNPHERPCIPNELSDSATIN